MDWWGNVLFAAGLILILVGITYGLLPYGGHSMGWTNPTVLAELFGGLAALVIFVIVEMNVAEPLFRLSLFRIRAFAAGNLANLLVALGRGGIQFILIIWLQGIWLPLHGYDFSVTPLWAGIYLVPLTIGFLVSAPLAGIVSDRFGAWYSPRAAALLTAVSFPVLLFFLPVNLRHGQFGGGAGASTGSGSGCSPLPQPGSKDLRELGARQRARRCGRDDRDLPEHCVRAVHRHLFLADRDRPGQHAAVGDFAGADGTGILGRGRGARLAPAADLRAVLLVPRLQPRW